MRVEAHAKINLTLEVLGLRPDGYHEIRSVVQPIPLADEILLEPAQEVTLAMHGGPADLAMENNLAFRAVRLLQRVSGRRDGVAVTITKRIPAGGGLAMLGAEIGSDVPALVTGGRVLMEGRGEKVTPLDDAKGPDLSRLELSMPPVASSTAAVYREFRPQDRGLFRNDLQPAACRLYPQISLAIRNLEQSGCTDVMMSGSGSTVFGFRSRP